MTNSDFILLKDHLIRWLNVLPFDFVQYVLYDTSLHSTSLAWSCINLINNPQYAHNTKKNIWRYSNQKLQTLLMY